MKKLFLLFFIATTIIAQVGSSVSSDPVSAGMGNTYNAYSKGLYSIGKNPANLSRMSENELQVLTIFPLPNINLNFGTSFFSMKDYNYYFGGVKNQNGQKTGRYLSQSELNDFQNLFEGGGSVSIDASNTLLGLAYNFGNNLGSVAIKIEDYIGVQLTLPESIIDLADGNEVEKVFNFSDSDFQAVYTRNYSFSYSTDLSVFSKVIPKSFLAGFSIKYVEGYALVSTSKISTSLKTGTQNEIITGGEFIAHSSFSNDFGVQYNFDIASQNGGSFSMFPSPAGRGFGLDFGINYQVSKSWGIAAAITDIGNINWDNKIAEFYSSTDLVIDDLTESDKLDSLFNSIKSDGYYIDKIKTSLPTTLRLGTAVSVEGFIPGEFVIVADYNQGLNDRPGNSLKPRLSLGSQWIPTNLVSIRTGITFGGRNGFGWALGAGLDFNFLELNFAANNISSWISPNSAKRFNISMGSIFKF